MTEDTAEGKGQDFEKKIDETLEPEEAIPKSPESSNLTTSSEYQSSNASEQGRRSTTLVIRDHDISTHFVISEINCERNYCLKNRILYNKIIDDRYGGYNNPR